MSMQNGSVGASIVLASIMYITIIIGNVAIPIFSAISAILIYVKVVEGALVMLVFHFICMSVVDPCHP